MRLICHFEFDKRQNLWSTQPRKYIAAPCLGSTGMGKHWFQEIFSIQQYSKQPETQPEGMSSETYPWKLVDNHVANLNKNWEKHYGPSEVICVDESLLCWYEIGGHWINAGLPQYTSINQKPEDECEIPNVADGKYGIMMRLRVVKTSMEEERANYNEEQVGLNHGTKILLDLTRSWHRKQGGCLVCADSYFASV